MGDQPIIHYLGDLVCEKEYNAMDKHFKITPFVSSIPNNSFVIPRYTVQPYSVKHYYSELEYKNLTPINSFRQHTFVANINEWYYELEGLTPKTWFSHEFNQIKDSDGPFVVRGLQKSRKDNWANKMFAYSKREAINIVTELYQDSGFGFSDCVIRKYVPLIARGVGINDMPITEEYRIFYVYGREQYSHLYWTNYLELFEKKDYRLPVDDCKLQELLTKVISYTDLFNKINWVSLDVAKTLNGEWIIIEVNDGQRSGIPFTSEEDLEIFYKNLRKLVNERDCRQS